MYVFFSVVSVVFVVITIFKGFEGCLRCSNLVVNSTVFCSFRHLIIIFNKYYLKILLVNVVRN